MSEEEKKYLNLIDFFERHLPNIDFRDFPLEFSLIQVSRKLIDYLPDDPRYVDIQKQNIEYKYITLFSFKDFSSSFFKAHTYKSIKTALTELKPYGFSVTSTPILVEVNEIAPFNTYINKRDPASISKNEISVFFDGELIIERPKIETAVKTYICCSFEDLCDDLNKRGFHNYGKIHNRGIETTLK